MLFFLCLMVFAILASLIGLFGALAVVICGALVWLVLAVLVNEGVLS